MHLLLGTPLILVSVGLAIATYIGVRLLGSPAKESNRLEASVDTLNLVSELGKRLPTAELRQSCLELCIKARTLLSQFKEGGGSAEGEFMVQQYLEQTHKGLEVLLSQGNQKLGTRKESLEVLAQLLHTVYDRFEGMQKTLDAQDDQAIAGEIKMLTKTLADLDQFSVTLNQGN